MAAIPDLLTKISQIREEVSAIQTLPLTNTDLMFKEILNELRFLKLEIAEIKEKQRIQENIQRDNFEKLEEKLTIGQEKLEVKLASLQVNLRDNQQAILEVGENFQRSKIEENKNDESVLDDEDKVQDNDENKNKHKHKINNTDTIEVSSEKTSEASIPPPKLQDPRLQFLGDWEMLNFYGPSQQFANSWKWKYTLSLEGKLEETQIQGDLVRNCYEKNILAGSHRRIHFKDGKLKTYCVNKQNKPMVLERQIKMNNLEIVLKRGDGKVLWTCECEKV